MGKIRGHNTIFLVCLCKTRSIIIESDYLNFIGKYSK